MNSKKIKRSREDFLLDMSIYFILGLCFIIVAYPLYFVIIASFSDPNAIFRGEVMLLPKNISIEGYKRIFAYKAIWTGYYNTLIYTFTGTALSVFLTMTIAYPLSLNKFSGRKFILIYLMITMYIGGGLIPTYLLVRNLGLHNTRAVMAILGALSIFNVIVTKTFLQTNIPPELEDAAAIDGCSPIRFFIFCVLPLSSAILAVLTLWYAVGQWNDFMTALIYITDTSKYPLQLVVRSILFITHAVMSANEDPTEYAKMQQAAEQLKYGVIIVSAVPLLLLYPFLQKFFIKGVMIGSIKG